MIDLVQTGGLNNFSINSISAVLAPPPTVPDPPIIPPKYINVSLNHTTTMINTTDIDDLYNNTTSYTIPSHLIIEREPSSDVSCG